MFKLSDIKKNPKNTTDSLNFKPVSSRDLVKKQNEYSATAETFINTQPKFILYGPIWLIFVVVFGALIYSFIAVIETKVTTVINIDGENYIVQAPVTGSVSSVLVSENEEIRSGQQILNILSETTLIAEEDIEYAKAQIKDYVIKYNQIQYTVNEVVRLAIDYSTITESFKVDLPVESKTQKNELSDFDYAGNEYLTTYKGSDYFQRISSLKVRLADMLKSYQRAKSLLQKQQKIYDEDKELFEKGVITEPQFTGSFQSLSAAEATVENYSNNFKVIFYTTIQEFIDERNSIFNEIRSLRNAVSEEELLEDEVIIEGKVALMKSRYPGVVSEVFVKPYEYVSKGMATINIIRNDLPKTGVVYIGNQNIGKIKRGQKVFVKLEAYPYQDYGVQLGRIVEVSPDVKVVEGFGFVYEAKVSFEEINPRVKLKYGMRGTADIETGTKRLIELVFGPMTKVFDYLSGKSEE